MLEKILTDWDKKFLVVGIKQKEGTGTYINLTVAGNDELEEVLKSFVNFRVFNLLERNDAEFYRNKFKEESGLKVREQEITLMQQLMTKYLKPKVGPETGLVLFNEIVEQQEIS